MSSSDSGAAPLCRDNAAAAAGRRASRGTPAAAAGGLLLLLPVLTAKTDVLRDVLFPGATKPLGGNVSGFLSAVRAAMRGGTAAVVEEGAAAAAAAA
jgi:hypothetical protein